MRATSLIDGFLHDARVPYSVVPHAPAYTAQAEAAVTHTAGRHWAKVVACFLDDRPVLAVVPAPTSVNLRRLLQLAGAVAARLAREGELPGLFPGCEAGAIPPLGPLYGQEVFVDVALAAEPEIVFNGGTHADAIRMRWSDFAKVVRPIVGPFADPLDA
jgi:Ala-tRNA(Pro) deacylase